MRIILIALALLIAAVATARAGWEYTWGVNGAECAWGDASGCASTGTAPSPPPSGASDWGTAAWGQNDWGQ